ncbi:MAG TPA: hypothetical protein VLR90_12150, partial [Blastocatellia bacterium]|nr:hypothetical protein [Blastocatellia bacterium]
MLLRIRFDLALDQTYNRAASIHPMKTMQKKASFFSWAREVSRYQWLVLMVAWLGWVFDSMDGTLYSLVQKPSMIELMGAG